MSLTQPLASLGHVCLSALSYIWPLDSSWSLILPKPFCAFPRSCCYSVIAAAAAKLLQLCPTLCNPIDGSPPGSPIPGILQARTLEWVAISFSNAWKWKVKRNSLSRVRLFTTPWTAAYQASLSMGFSRQEYWTWVPTTHWWCINISNNELMCLCLSFFISKMGVTIVDTIVWFLWGPSQRIRVK